MKIGFYKFLIVSKLLLSSTTIFGQWENKLDDNGFEKPNKYGLCRQTWAKDVNLFLTKNSDKSKIVLAVWNLHNDYCIQVLKCDLSFELDTGRLVMYDYECNLSVSPNTLIISEDLKNENKKRLLDAFLKCKVLKIRFINGECGEETYYFNMTGSSSAFNWVNG
jgi:hypothetical protein